LQQPTGTQRHQRDDTRQIEGGYEVRPAASIHHDLWQWAVEDVDKALTDPQHRENAGAADQDARRELPARR
jgi:hypothetical protein